jgi:hypothetical protein
MQLHDVKSSYCGGMRAAAGVPLLLSDEEDEDHYDGRASGSSHRFTGSLAHEPYSAAVAAAVAAATVSVGSSDAGALSSSSSPSSSLSYMTAQRRQQQKVQRQEERQRQLQREQWKKQIREEEEEHEQEQRRQRQLGEKQRSKSFHEKQVTFDTQSGDRMRLMTKSSRSFAMPRGASARASGGGSRDTPFSAYDQSRGEKGEEREQHGRRKYFEDEDDPTTGTRQEQEGISIGNESDGEDWDRAGASERIEEEEMARRSVREEVEDDEQQEEDGDDDSEGDEHENAQEKSNQLTAFLALAKLSHVEDSLREEGYEEIEDFTDASDADLKECGLKKPEIKRLRRYLPAPSRS